ncbi:MAG: DUF2975 domain-containing protein [Flavobacteriaceae bacterium]|nr:DUF2975 domain-containing protein [Flavobacteriaceae bacterium]
MTKNRLLNIAITICKIIKLIYILSFILTTVIFIHIQIDREAYNDIKINYTGTPTTFSIGLNKSYSDKWKDPYNEVYVLEKLTTTTIYLIYFKFTCIFILLFLSIKEFQNIIQSVKRLDTFRLNNILSFRQIGKYSILYFILTLLYFILSFNNTLYFGQGGFSQTSISFTPLLFALISFILAEIFKEGNKLQQENELTV